MDKDLRIQQLLEANNRYVEQNRKLKATLSKCKLKFQFYAEEHEKKGRAFFEAGKFEEAEFSVSKQDTNLNMVSLIDDAFEECRPV